MGNSKSEGKMVKQESMIIAALITFIAGFLIGVVFSSSQSPVVTTKTSVPQQSVPQGQQGGGISPDQAARLLSLEQEVAANPQNGQAWTNLGNIYFDNNRFPQAINAYNKSLELNPNQPNVWTDLGVMYRRSKQPLEAIKCFEKAMTLDPTHETARFNKGIVLMYDLNDKAGARSAWEELLTINPLAMAPNGQPLKELIKSTE